MYNSRDIEKLKSVLQWSLEETNKSIRGISQAMDMIIGEMETLKQNKKQTTDELELAAMQVVKKMLTIDLYNASSAQDKYITKSKEISELLQKLK